MFVMLTATVKVRHVYGCGEQRYGYFVRNVRMMYLKFYRAKVWKANNAVDTDISGHISAFIFPRVCFVT